MAFIGQSFRASVNVLREVNVNVSPMDPIAGTLVSPRNALGALMNHQVCMQAVWVCQIIWGACCGEAFKNSPNGAKAFRERHWLQNAQVIRTIGAQSMSEHVPTIRCFNNQFGRT